MTAKLRIVIADDERPARLFLLALLRSFEDVDVVAEATNGTEAIEKIERERPDLALLDLQMPEVDGLGVVRLIKKDRLPLVAFVTAYDEFAVKAFELNAVDYLLKPVERGRLRDTLNRAHERLERADFRQSEAEKLATAVQTIDAQGRSPYLERIPVRQRDAICLLAVETIASIVADGELLHLTSASNERYTLSYRLKDLASKLPPDRFVRLTRGTLVHIERIVKISPLPGGTYHVLLSNDQQFSVSRLQSRVLREQLLKI